MSEGKYAPTDEQAEDAGDEAGEKSEQQLDEAGLPSNDEPAEADEA